MGGRRPPKGSKASCAEEFALREKLTKLLMAFNGYFQLAIRPNPKPEDAECFAKFLHNLKFDGVEAILRELDTRQESTAIPEHTTFLQRAKLLPILESLLKNTTVYGKYLPPFIERFRAHNERIPPDLNAPLHHAVQQLNVDLFQWLLAQPETLVNIRNGAKKTPLLIACEMYNTASKQHGSDPHDVRIVTIRDFILHLLDKGADFNVCSLRLRLPFELLQENQATKEGKDFVRQCVERAQGAIVIFQGVERNEKIVEFYPPGRAIVLTEELLELFLRYGDELSFRKFFDPKKIHSQVGKVIEVLLHMAVEYRMGECARKIIKNYAKQIFEEEPGSTALVNRGTLKGLLKKVCLSGDAVTLKLLLSRIKDQLLINDDPLLEITLNEAHRLREWNDKCCALLQCAELLAREELVDLTKVDEAGNTPLHLAVKYDFDQIVLVLVRERHIFLGWRNGFHLTPLDYAGYEFWYSIFNRCVEVDMHHSMPDRNVIRLNLKCFEPLADCGLPVGSTPRKITEMAPMLQIAQSKELKPLLIHPVLYTFVLVKWMRLKRWNYLNLLLTTITALFFAAHSLSVCTYGEQNISLLLSTMSGTAYITAREVIQLLFLRKEYFTFENMRDITLNAAILVVLVNGCNATLSAFVVVAFAMQLTSLLGSLHFNTLSTIMYMFNTVSVNFLKSFLLFTPLLAAFSYGFYLSYNDSPDAARQNSKTFATLNNFRTFWDASLKTLVMTAGEFEAAAIDLTGGKFYLFIAFLFFAPIVLLNLINGLAVSDITAIRQVSELISITKKVLLLERYERGARKIRPAILSRLFPTPFFDDHQSWILVKPKESRKVLVQPRKGAPRELPIIPLVPCYCCGNFLSLGRRFVDEALRLADGEDLRSIETKPVVEVRRMIEELRRENQELQYQVGKILQELQTLTKEMAKP